MAATPIVGPITTTGDDFVASYEELYLVAFRVAYRLLGDHAEAEDIAQESCIRASSRWRKLSAGGYAKPWVAHVAGNLAVDRFRRIARAKKYQDLREASPRSLDSERVDLHRALERLPKRQREVIVLRYFGDMTEVQVGEVLHISRGAVKSHASRALATLRELLDIGEED